MIAMTLAEIAAAVRGRVVLPPEDGRTADRVVVAGPAYIDSREPATDGLYVAIVGERVDGHDFADGAHAVLGTRPTGAPTVVVDDDPVAALGRLARHVLDRLGADRPTVFALTGSQGKTGTKDYLAAILAAQGPTVATSGNANNEIGVPLTALRADPGTRFLVVEMGARGIRHIEYLCEIAPPDVAAVLNVGTAHLAEFGSVAAIAVAKGEIVEALTGDGVAVLNADDPHVAPMRLRTRGRVLEFGEGAEVGWRDVDYDDLGHPRFTLAYAGQEAPVTLRLPGRHQTANAVAAAAMALGAGIGLDAIATALSAAGPASRWRMELTERPDGMVVLNDAYNANPASMASAISSAVQIAAARGLRTVAVLGEMLELGDDAEQAHREIGRLAAVSGVQLLITVGPASDPIADGAESVAGWGGTALRTASRDDATARLVDNVSGSDLVLVKASRGAALEVVAETLLAAGEPGGTGAEEASEPHNRNNASERAGRPDEVNGEGEATTP